MRRFAVVAVVLASVGAAHVGVASAGGSWFSVQRVEGLGSPGSSSWAGWAAPGATVTVAGRFCRTAGDGSPGEPLTTFLRPEERAAGRIALGSVSIDTSAEGPCSSVARSTFVVPTVAAGRYLIDVCPDARCSSSGIGDLAGGFITVAHSAREARALTMASRASMLLEALRRDRRELREEVERFATSNEELAGELGAARGSLLAAEERRGSATRRIAELTSGAAALRDDLARWRVAAIASGLVLVLVVMAGVVARRRSRFLVPDTPAELLDRVDAAGDDRTAARR